MLSYQDVDNPDRFRYMNDARLNLFDVFIGWNVPEDLTEFMFLLNLFFKNKLLSIF